MFNWLKPKAKKSKTAAPANPPEKQDKTALIAEAQKNARAAKEAIGQENLDRLIRLIQEKQEVSPAAQARKIIAKMDTDKIADHLRYLRNEPPTKH